MHGVLGAVADVDRTQHHEHAGHILGRLIPPLVLRRRLGGDAELQLHSVAVLDKYPVLIDDLVL